MLSLPHGAPDDSVQVDSIDYADDEDEEDDAAKDEM